MKKLKGDVAIELTRRCNQNCEHCLRGCSENIDSTKAIIRKTLSSYSYIPSLTLTGGEPTLVDDLIKYAIDTMIEKKIPYGGVYIVTNGMRYSRRLINSMRKAYQNADVPEICGLCVSVDEYHRPYSTEAYDNYSMEPYFRTDKEVDAEKRKYRKIINEGNAYWNGIGQLNRAYNDHIHRNQANIDDEGIEYYDDLVYVSSNGNVVFDCDMSYDNIDMNTVGNIKESSLYDIVAANVR